MSPGRNPDDETRMAAWPGRLLIQPELIYSLPLGRRGSPARPRATRSSLPRVFASDTNFVLPSNSSRQKLAAPQIEAVTFDVGGTLIQPWPSVGGVYAHVAAEHGVTNLSPENLNKNFARAWRAKKEFQHTYQDWAKLVDQTFAGLCAPPSQTFFPAIYQRFAEMGAWRMYDDALPALDGLASKDIPLAVISNWDARLRPLLQQFRLDRYFEIIVVSCEVGFAKPSPVIFEHAAKKLGIAPEHIVHIGDSAPDDVAGAEAAGIAALLIDRDKKGIEPGRISSLRHLEGILFPQ